MGKRSRAQAVVSWPPWPLPRARSWRQVCISTAHSGAARASSSSSASLLLAARVPGGGAGAHRPAPAAPTPEGAEGPEGRREGRKGLRWRRARRILFYLRVQQQQRVREYSVPSAAASGSTLRKVTGARGHANGHMGIWAWGGLGVAFFFTCFSNLLQMQDNGAMESRERECASVCVTTAPVVDEQD